MPAPSLSKPKTVPRNITKKDLEQYTRLVDEAREMSRKESALRKQASALATDIKTFVEAKAGKVRTMLRSGFRLSIVSKPGRVAWKSEYVKEVGAEQADKLVAEAPEVDRLQVEKV